MAAQQAPRAGPSTVRDATPSASSAAPSAPAAPLQRDKGLGDYIEFDLTRLQNSKGGFLVEDTGESALQALEEQRKEREREKQRLRDQMEPGISLDPTTRPVCEMCNSSDILYDPFLRVFNVRVCRACERAHPEKYSLLTKTEVKEVRSHDSRKDYLLTDGVCRVTDRSGAGGWRVAPPPPQEKSSQVDLQQHDAIFAVPSRALCIL